MPLNTSFHVCLVCNYNSVNEQRNKMEMMKATQADICGNDFVEKAWSPFHGSIANRGMYWIQTE